MNPASISPVAEVSPEEVARRIAEWRRVGLEQRLPAVIVYPPAEHRCPWSGCERVIAGIDFQLHKLGDSTSVERWRAAWWQGPGLVGRCPGCGRYVLFGYHDKQPARDLVPFAGLVLPDDWTQYAVLAPQAANP